VATGLNDMFSRLQSSENNVKFHSENLLKLKFFENFSNFKLVGNYYSKLIIDYICKFVPESQHKNFIIQYKDTCHGNSSNDEENFKKAILKFDFTEKEKTLSDLMKSKFLQSREELELYHGCPVQVTRQSKLVSLPKMVAIQISRISSKIDSSELTEEDKGNVGYRGPIAPEKRRDGKFRGTCEINDESIKMPSNFDFKPYFDKISLNQETKYKLKMFITFKIIDNKLVYSLIVKENDSKWYEIQDKKVDEVTINSDNLNSGYIYFYEQERKTQ